MFMRHLGGGIGHVNNVHPFSSATNSEGYLEDGGDNDDDEVDSAAIDLTTLGHILAETTLAAYQGEEGEGPSTTNDAGDDDDEDNEELESEDEEDDRML